ncbi:MAG: hypothetical protein RLZZ44_57, partial [Bacteroidota bacterium]
FNKIKLKNINSKVNFIKKYIYFPTRTWHNWLETEWEFRKNFDSSDLSVSHNLNILHSNYDQTYKFLALDVKPSICLKNYLKFNSCLDSTSQENFLMYNKDWLTQCKKIAENKEKIKIINCDNLYSNNLDYDTYYQIISWLDIDDQYETACKIHKLWFDLQKQAEKQFIEDITKLYSENP